MLDGLVARASAKVPCALRFCYGLLEFGNDFGHSE